MIEYIDTHVHLYDEMYDGDFNVVLERMKESGVIQCILPGIDSSHFDRQENCAARCGNFVFQAMGFHPTSVGANWKEELDFAVSKLYSGNKNNPCPNHRKYVAVGEIGLDGYWSREFMREQMEVFEKQLLVAEELDLPVIIHVREATNEVFEVLEKMRGRRIRGVFHAFAGSIETFERILSYGDFKVGIGGVVTYKNAGIAKTLEMVPLESVLLETDAPWLTPVPFRGKRNESTYLTYIASAIAGIKGCTLEEVARITTGNARKMFGI